MDCSMPGFPVHHQLLEFTQTHVHWVSDAIQPSYPLSSSSPPIFNLSQHQGLFKWVGSSHKVAKVLEFQLQHQSFQWISRTDFLQDGLVGSPCSPRDSQESSLSRFVITFLPRSNHLLISWLQSPSAVIFRAQEEEICHYFHFFPFSCREVMGPDAMILVFFIFKF